jgi:hypothetical protein
MKRGLDMLSLVEELQNISLASAAGISRTHFSGIKEAFARYGLRGLTASHPAVVTWSLAADLPQ